MPKKISYDKTIAISSAMLAYVGVVGLFIAFLKLFQETNFFAGVTNRFLAMLIVLIGGIYVYKKSARKTK